MADERQTSPQVTLLRESFRKLEVWLGAHCPRAYEDLQAGARNAQLAVVESELGLSFPEELAAFFREHDGQSGEGPPVFPPFELLDLESSMREWRAERRANGDCRALFPIASNGKGGVVCVALSGTESSAAVYQTEPNTEPRLVAPNISSWMDEQLSVRDENTVSSTTPGTGSPRAGCHFSSFPPG
jgi:hypothetical protein